MKIGKEYAFCFEKLFVNQIQKFLIYLCLSCYMQTRPNPFGELEQKGAIFVTTTLKTPVFISPDL
jgi:hypothetical protein